MLLISPDMREHGAPDQYSLHFGPVSISYGGLSAAEREGLAGVAAGTWGPPGRSQNLFRDGAPVERRFTLNVAFRPRPEPPWTTNPMWLDYESETGQYRSRHRFWDAVLPEPAQDDHALATVSMGPHPREEGSSCLLYTSPSPRDATLSRMPSSA